MILILLASWIALYSDISQHPMGSDVHAIHVSKCEIQYNQESSSLEVATQIYLDDLQLQLTNLGAPDLHLCTEKESKLAEKELLKYLTQKLKIKVDGKEIEGTFIGKEPSEDMLAIWTYIEYQMPLTFSKVNVRYDILMDLYDDQKNIVNIKVKGKKSYMLFNKKHVEETINY